MSVVASQGGTARRSVAPVSNGARSQRVGGTTTSPADGGKATLGAAAAILDLGQLRFSPKLDFITTNRVVGVLERAVERLELLSLLDATAASSTALQSTKTKHGHAASSKTTSGGANALDGLVFSADPEAAAAAAAEDAMISHMIGTTTKTEGVRTAALFTGPVGDTLRRTAPAVNAALAQTAKTRRNGRMTVAELVKEQRRLEARYAELLRVTQRVAPPVTDPTLHPRTFAHIHDSEQVALTEELHVTSHQLREYNKILCTHLRDNPDDADNWKKIRNERQELITLLQGTIAELTTGYQESRRQQYDGTGTLDAGSFRSGARSGVHSAGSHLNSTLHRGGANNNSSRSLNATMSNGAGGVGGGEAESTHSVLKRFGSMAQMRRTTKSQTAARRIPLSSSYDGFARKVLQERAAQRWADELVRKERELNQNVKQLQCDLIAERAMKEAEVGERQQTIHDLELQLRELKKALKQRSDEAKVRVEATSEGEKRGAAEQQRELVEQTQRQQYLLNVEERTYGLFAEHLRKKTEAMDSLASEWDTKNQREIKKAEMSKMDAEQTRQQCADRLLAREQDLEKETDLKEARDEELEAKRTEEAAVEQRTSVKYEAASKLESALKAMLTRQALAKQLKKSKKQKKKKSA